MTAIESFLKNNPFMIQSLSQNEDEIDKNTTIANALNSVKSDDSSLADLYENWLDLLSNDDLQLHRDVMIK